MPRSPPLSYGDGWITENPLGPLRFYWISNPSLEFTGIGFSRRQIPFVGFKLCRNRIVRPEHFLELWGLLLLLGRRSHRVISSFGGIGASGDWRRGANIDPVHAEVIALWWAAITAAIMQQYHNNGLLDEFVADHKPSHPLHFHRKNMSQFICYTRLPWTACNALNNVFQHRIPTAYLICCTNVIYVV